MLNGILFTIALFMTLMLISYKLSAFACLMKFDQEETSKQAYMSALVMLIISILWGIIFAINID